MGWPFETTPNERKRERKSGYEHGLKGNSVGTNWSGKEYRKGAEAGYQKYCDNKKKKEERNKSNNKSESYSGNRSSSNKKDRSSRSYNDYSYTSYGSSSGNYSSSSGYSSSDTSGANPVSVFFKVIGGIIGLIVLLSMCNSKSNSPSPAKENFQQQHESVKKAKKASKHVDEPVAGEVLRDPTPSYPPAQAIEELKPAGTAAEIEGAFGYRFGDTVLRSNIIDRYENAFPDLLESYHVTPLIQNRGLDTYSVTMCKSFHSITNISGSKLFNSREEAMTVLEKYKQFLENKYGTFNQPTIYDPTDGTYKETLIKNAASVSVLVINKSMDPPQWAFMIMYDNIPLTRQCGVQY